MAAQETEEGVPETHDDLVIPLSVGANDRVSRLGFKDIPYNPFIVQMITGGYFAGRAASGIY